MVLHFVVLLLSTYTSVIYGVDGYLVVLFPSYGGTAIQIISVLQLVRPAIPLFPSILLLPPCPCSVHRFLMHDHNSVRRILVSRLGSRALRFRWRVDVMLGSICNNLGDSSIRYAKSLVDV